MAPANFQKPLKLLACRSSNHEPCSMKKVFLEISQNSQKNTYARVSRLYFLVFGLNTEIYGVNFRIHSKKTKESITSQKLGSQYFWQACNFIKNETLAQVFSCEFCEISKNTFLQNTSERLLLCMLEN